MPDRVHNLVNELRAMEPVDPDLPVLGEKNLLSIIVVDNYQSKLKQKSWFRYEKGSISNTVFPVRICFLSNLFWAENTIFIMKKRL